VHAKISTRTLKRRLISTLGKLGAAAFTWQNPMMNDAKNQAHPSLATTPPSQYNKYTKRNGRFHATTYTFQE